MSVIDGLWTYLFLVLLQGSAVHTETGLSSMYHPGDGHCGSMTSCGRPFTWASDHIAHRRWHKWGCGRRIIVCVIRTGRCALTKIGDSGPWGITNGKQWKVWTKLRVPVGWRRRGHYDLAHALWARLGKPKFLSRLRVYFLPRTRTTQTVACALTTGGASDAGGF